MLEALITSKTRIKLLVKFFLNRSNAAWLRHLETEFGESTNAIRVELNRFEQAGLLGSFMQGNKKLYRANASHPLYDEIHRLVIKYTGMDHIVEQVAEKLGDLEKVFLTGDFAHGHDNGVIDLVFIAGGLDMAYLARLVDKAEKMIDRRIRYMVCTRDEYKTLPPFSAPGDVLLLWDAKNRNNS